MPAVIRKSDDSVSLVERRRDLVHSISWTVRSSAWSPPTDVYETEDAIIVRVEVAGMREEDFEIALEDGFLKISGTRPDVPERRAYHQMEIRFGKFSTAVGLPAPVNVEKSQAEYEDGFLTITLPKTKPNFIQVKE
ncbi:MAG: Hsp20/alpha crystallin family protein [Chloroflexi bacterium]|nr:Hsp20/alpha crystallin family protein [Chloroflexota bacterium]